MPKRKNKIFKFFCTTCKQHFEFIAEKNKDAQEKFESFGHETVRTKQLLRGRVGYYTEA